MIPNSFANHLFLLLMTELSVLCPKALHKRYDAKKPIGVHFCKLRPLHAMIS